VGNYPFFHNYNLILRELFVRISNESEQPIEVVISHMVNTLYLTQKKIFTYKINSEEINFYHQPVYGEFWDTVINSYSYYSYY